MQTYAVVAALGLILLVAALGLVLLVAAVMFKAGRKQMRDEMTAWYQKHRCKECGAIPQLILRHISGCESGWPDPSALKLPGEDG
jgi:hypothetical protein